MHTTMVGHRTAALQADRHAGVEGIVVACPSQCAYQRACTLGKSSCRQNGRARSKGECSGIACHGDTGGSREIWGTVPDAIGQAVCCREDDGTHTEGAIPTVIRPGHIAIAMTIRSLCQGEYNGGDGGKCIPIAEGEGVAVAWVHPRQAAMARTRKGHSTGK